MRLKAECLLERENLHMFSAAANDSSGSFGHVTPSTLRKLKQFWRSSIGKLRNEIVWP